MNLVRNGIFLRTSFSFNHVCKQISIRFTTLGASLSLINITIVKLVQNFFLLYDLIANSMRIILSFNEIFFCVLSSSLGIGITMVTPLKPITPVAPRYEPNLYRRGVTALADLMITIEMLLAPHNSRETLFFGGPLKLIPKPSRILNYRCRMSMKIMTPFREPFLEFFFVFIP